MIFTDKTPKDAGKVVDGDKIVVLSSAQASISRAVPTPSTSTPLVPATEIGTGRLTIEDQEEPYQDVVGAPLMSVPGSWAMAYATGVHGRYSFNPSARLSGPQCSRRMAMMVLASTIVPLMTMSYASSNEKRRTSARGVSGPSLLRSDGVSPVARNSAVCWLEKLGVLMKRENWLNRSARIPLLRVACVRPHPMGARQGKGMPRRNFQRPTGSGNAVLFHQWNLSVR